MIARLKTMSCGFGAFCVAAGFSAAALAADLPSTSPPPAPAAPVAAAVAPLGFFVKLGLLYANNYSTSKIFAQVPPGGGPQFPVPNATGGIVGGDIANVVTLGFEVGYFVTPNISIDVSGGLPMYAKVTTNALSGIGPKGTVLGQIMPAVAPVTIVYHFTQMGAVQPYLGVGVTPAFSFANKNGFDTGISVDPTIGLALQAGADVMFDPHWGVFVDVKKLFIQGTSHGTGINPVPGLNLPVTSTLKSNFQPWLLSTGVAYRF